MTIAESQLSHLWAWLTTPDAAWAFCSVPFLAVFCLFLSFYLLLRRFSRQGMLAYVTGFGLLFAWKAGGVSAGLLPATVAASWLLTRLLLRAEGGWRKAVAAVTVAAELAPLLYYKYTHFFAEVFAELLHTNFAPAVLVVPVGLSFYTFQAVSYTVDVYRRRWDGRDTFLEYSFYLTFFPLLLAGPITRAETLLPQVRMLRPATPRLVYGGLFLVLAGLLKKGVVADYIAQYNNWIFDDPTAYSGFENLMGLLGYTLQIYCDFSGYSDISIGLAGVLGFRLRENFRLPYRSLNVTEFWRRWHIALSTWFRDYLYIPLGGNRHGRLRTSLNCVMTMLAAGLWHGATGMFVVWGAMHGAALVVHKTLKPWLDTVPNVFFVRLLSWLLTFGFLTVSWAYFRAETPEVAAALFGNIRDTLSWDYLMPFVQARPTWSAFVALGFACHGLHYRGYVRLQHAFIRSPWVLKLLLASATVAAVAYFRTDEVPPFIYSRF